MPLGKTSYLQIPLMAEADNQKYLLFNDSIQALDDSLNRLLVLDFTGTNLTLTESQLTRYGAFRGTGNGIPRTLTIPQSVGGSPAITTNRFFVFQNAGGDTITLTHGVGTSVAVAAGTVTLVLCDGTDIISVASAAGFDMGVREEGGGNIVNNPTFLNFIGQGVTASLNGLGADIDITMPEVQDDATSVQTDTTSFNFTGAGVTATASGNGVEINIPGATSGVDVENAGVSAVTAAAALNFIGANVTAVDNGGDADITIQGPAAQDEGVAVQADPTFINFLGAGVTATTNGTGVDVTIPGATGLGVDLEDTGASILTGATVLDFRGNNVTVADVSGEGRISIASPTIRDEGTNTQIDPTFINFVGAGVTASSSGNGVNVNIPGASGTAIPVDDDGTNVVSAADRMNFIGPGVTVVANGNTADITIGGGGSAIDTQKDGVTVVTSTDTLNFVGSGVSVSNPSGDVTEINILQPLNNLVAVSEAYPVTPPVNGSYSTSAFATKGNIFNVLEDRVLSSVGVELDAGQTVKLVVARVDATNPNAILEILYDGTPRAISIGGLYQFTDVNVSMSAGTTYGVMFTRTDASATSSVDIGFPSGTPLTDPYGSFTFNTSIRYASIDPQVADNTASGLTDAVTMTLNTVDPGLESGLVNFSRSTPVAFHANRTSASTSAGGTLIFDGVDMDEGGDYNPATGIFTAPIAGVYHFYAGAVIDGGDTTGNLFIRVNGTQRVRSHSFSGSLQNDSHTALLSLRLSPGDTVDVTTSFDVAASTTPWNWFGGYLINASTGNSPLNIVPETSTALNSVLAHSNSYVTVDNASPITYTVDDDTLNNHDIGATITLEQVGTGTLTVAAGPGVSVRSSSTTAARAQYSVVMLTKVAADTWNLTGDLAP